MKESSSCPRKTHYKHHHDSMYAFPVRSFWNIYICECISITQMQKIQTDVYQTSRDCDYLYIGLFIFHFFLIMLAGSYMNIILFIIVWIFFFLKLHTHSILVTVLVAISTTFQSYSLSSNTADSFFATPDRDVSCYMSGVSRLENMRTVNPKCDMMNYKPFINSKSYQLIEDFDMMILHTNTRLSTEYEARKCPEIGLSCFMWKIKIPAVSERLLEPCLNLVDDILVHNTQRFMVLQTQSSNRARQKIKIEISNSSYILNDIMFNVVLDSTEDRSIFTQNEMLHMIPDMYTRFVLLPPNKLSFPEIRLTMTSPCNSKSAKRQTHQTGMLFLAAVAETAPFTLYYIFSGCESDCKHNMGGVICIYLFNIIFSVISLHITHDCRYKTQYSNILIYFWLATAVLIFNWIVVCCIVVEYFSLHHCKKTKAAVQILHIIQFVLILTEFIRNGFGQNTHYILSSQQTASFITFVFTPFKIWDHRVYFENCILFLVTNVYGMYILYIKNYFVLY